jgi:phage baseplate assembly protein W
MAAKPLGIVLPISLGSNGYFSSTNDPAEQIRSNLINLLLTRKGERVFLPEFGCDIPRTLFESNSDDSLAQAHAEIQTSVSTWMPFINIDEIVTKSRSVDGHEIVIEIKYTVLTNNTTDTIQLVF